MVIEPRAGGDLEDGTPAVGPAVGRRAEEVALRVEDQAAHRVGPVGDIEGGQGGDRAGAGGDLEDGTPAVGPAVGRRAEEVAPRVEGQRRPPDWPRWCS